MTEHGFGFVKKSYCNEDGSLNSIFVCKITSSFYAGERLGRFWGTEAG